MGLALLLAPAIGRAEGETVRASEAYERGAAAYERKEYAAAARAFAEADALAPSAVALQAALEACVDADDPVLGSELVERAKREPTTPSLATAADAARKRFARRAGRLRVHHGETCTTAMLDDRVVRPQADIWASVGVHALALVCGTLAKTERVEIREDAIVGVEAPEQAPAARAAPPEIGPRRDEVPLPPPRPAKPLPPIFVVAAGGAAVVAGGVAVALGVRTAGKHDDFTALGCGHVAVAGCAELQSSGQGARNVTNVLVGVTSVLAVTALVASIFFVDWHPSSSRSLAPGLVRF